MQSYKWLPLYVFFNCLLKLSAWTDAKSHWLHLYAFLQSEFSNVSSNCLPVQMQSRIGCICMLFQMSPQIVCPNRCKVAFIAFVCFSQVTIQMCPQIACLYRCIVALVAFVRFFSRVSFQMCPQIACLYRCIVALIAFEQFFTWGSFQMSPQIICPNRCKVALVAFVRFFT